MAQQPESSKKAKVEAAVQEWMQEKIANSVISQSTESWNHFQKQFPDLVARVVKAAE